MECVAAQDARKRAREISRRDAKTFDSVKFAECAAVGWECKPKEVRNVILSIVSAWVKRERDAVILHTPSERPEGSYLALQFVGKVSNDDDDPSIELRYVLAVDTEQKAKSFLFEDNFEVIEVSPDAFAAVNDELLLRNRLLQNDEGGKLHDYRPRKALHHTFLAPTEWKTEWTARYGQEKDEEKPVESEGPLPPPPPGVSCWICLDEEDDELGEPIRRDCSCRGSAGYVHFSCASSYSRRKYETAYKEAHDKADCRKAWEYCPNCHQKYGPRLAYKLATAFVGATEDLPEGDYRSLMAKILLAKKHHENERHKEARKILEKALDVIQSSRRGLVGQLEGDSLLCLG